MRRNDQKVRLMKFINHLLQEQIQFFVCFGARDQRRIMVVDALPINSIEVWIVKILIDGLPYKLERCLPLFCASLVCGGFALRLWRIGLLRLARPGGKDQQRP